MQETQEKLALGQVAASPPTSNHEASTSLDEKPPSKAGSSAGSPMSSYLVSLITQMSGVSRDRTDDRALAARLSIQRQDGVDYERLCLRFHDRIWQFATTHGRCVWPVRHRL